MVLKTESRHRLQQSLNETVFKNLLIADSGKGHVEEMVRMLRDLPGFRAARINLLHVVPEQGSAGSEEHWGAAASLLAQAVGRMGLDASEVNSIIRNGDAKQTVLKVAEELAADLIVMAPAWDACNRSSPTARASTSSSSPPDPCCWCEMTFMSAMSTG